MDCIAFLPFNLIEEISPNPEASVQIPKAFDQHEISKKTDMVYV